MRNGFVSDVDATTEGGRTALHVAARRNEYRNVQTLLEHGADYTMKDSISGATPLHSAARFGCHEAIAVFMDNGCEMEQYDKMGLTPALLALTHGHKDLATTLENFPHSRDM